jgi:hypothetical protein
MRRLAGILMKARCGQTVIRPSHVSSSHASVACQRLPNRHDHWVWPAGVSGRGIDSAGGRSVCSAAHADVDQSSPNL